MQINVVCPHCQRHIRRLGNSKMQRITCQCGAVYELASASWTQADMANPPYCAACVKLQVRAGERFCAIAPDKMILQVFNACVTGGWREECPDWPQRVETDLTVEQRRDRADRR